MDDSESLDFQWAGIDFRLQPHPRRSEQPDAPVLLRWRHPSGEEGSRIFRRVSDAMQHSSRMTSAAGRQLHA